MSILVHIENPVFLMVNHWPFISIYSKFDDGVEYDLPILGLLLILSEVQSVHILLQDVTIDLCTKGQYEARQLKVSGCFWTRNVLFVDFRWDFPISTAQIVDSSLATEAGR